MKKINFQLGMMLILVIPSLVSCDTDSDLDISSDNPAQLMKYTSYSPFFEGAELDYLFLTFYSDGSYILQGKDRFRLTLSAGDRYEETTGYLFLYSDQRIDTLKTEYSDNLSISGRIMGDSIYAEMQQE